MTIGQQGDTSAFVLMRRLKKEMCVKHGLAENEFELSMGMSGDF